LDHFSCNKARLICQNQCFLDFFSPGGWRLRVRNAHRVVAAKFFRGPGLFISLLSPLLLSQALGTRLPRCDLLLLQQCTPLEHLPKRPRHKLPRLVCFVKILYCSIFSTVLKSTKSWDKIQVGCCMMVYNIRSTSAYKLVHACPFRLSIVTYERMDYNIARVQTKNTNSQKQNEENMRG
jgi:hypothetical protein